MKSTSSSERDYIRHLGLIFYFARIKRNGHHRKTMVSKEERLALCTSVPQLLDMIAVNTKFKIKLITRISGMLDGEKLDFLVEQYQGKEFTFRLTQLMKTTVREDQMFKTFVEVLRGCGQTDAAGLLESEVIRHSRNEQSQTPNSLRECPGISTQKTAKTSKKNVNKDSSEECSERKAEDGAHSTSKVDVKRQSTQDTTKLSKPEGLSLTADDFSAIRRYNEQKVVMPTGRPGERHISRREADDLREFLRTVLPASRGPEEGDIALNDAYYRSLDSFLESRSQVHPGPLQALDNEATDFDREEVMFMPPDGCVQVAKRLGGEPVLCFSRDRGRPVLRSVRTRDIKYCFLRLYLHPGQLFVTTRFALKTVAVHDIVTRFVTSTSFTIKSRIGSQLEEVNPTMTIEEWSHRTSKLALNVFLENCSRIGSSMEVQRSPLLQALQNTTSSFAGVAVPRSYKADLVNFLMNATSTLPGQLKALSDSHAYHESHVAFIPAECCAMVVKLFGGEPELQLRKHGGCAALFDTEGGFQYFGVVLHTTDGSLRDSPFPEIGSYYLSVSASLEDVIASAVGWFPRRAWAQTTLVKLDLTMRFREVVSVMTFPGIILEIH